MGIIILASGVQGFEVLMDKATVFLDKNVIEPYLAVAREELHHVPMDSGTVPVVALVVTLPRRKMD